MGKTIDGVDIKEVQHLWQIEYGEITKMKVVQFLPQLSRHRSYRETLELNCHLCYSTELAATEALIKHLENELIKIDKIRQPIVDKILTLRNMECITLKLHKENKKPTKIGNIRI